MSKLYTEYLQLKADNPDSLYLFKSGAFYLFLDKDAQFISQKFNLKLVQLNKHVVKCGFPATSLEKYLKLLQDFDLDVQIIDEVLPYKYFSLDYLSIQKSLYVLNTIHELDIDSLTPIQAMQLLIDFKSKLEEK